MLPKSKFAPRWPTFAVVAIVFFALVVRLIGINHGLPFLYDADEPTFVAVAAKMLAGHDLNPHWFMHPGTPALYLTAAAFAAVYVFGLTFGILSGPDEFKALYFNDPTMLFTAARTLFAVLGAASCLVLYRIGAQLQERWAGVLAAAILAVIPVSVAFSQIVRADMLMALFLLLSFLYLIQLLESDRTLSAILCGIFLGFAIATKYPGAFFSIVIAIGCLTQTSRLVVGIRQLGIVGISAFIGLFIASPFLFIDVQAVWLDLSIQDGAYHPGATGGGFWSNLNWYFTVALRNNVGHLGLLLFTAGALWIIRRGTRSERLVVASALVLLCCLSLLHQRWERWAIPIMPFVSLIIAIAIIRTSALVADFQFPKVPRFPSGTAKAASTLFLAFLVLAPMTVQSLRNSLTRAAGDTRTVAHDWIIENVPRGSTIALEAGGPQLPKRDYRLMTQDSGRLVVPESREEKPLVIPKGALGNIVSLDEIKANQVDYVVLSGMRSRNEAELAAGWTQYVRPVEIYRQLTTESTRIWSVQPAPLGIAGPGIEIYRVR